MAIQQALAQRKTQLSMQYITAGGVGAALFLIIVIEFIVILVWIYRRLVPIHQHTQLV